MKKLISFLKNCFHLQNLYCENDVLLCVVLFRKRFVFHCKKKSIFILVKTILLFFIVKIKGILFLKKITFICIVINFAF